MKSQFGVEHLKYYNDWIDTEYLIKAAHVNNITITS